MTLALNFQIKIMKAEDLQPPMELCFSGYKYVEHVWTVECQLNKYIRRNHVTR